MTVIRGVCPVCARLVHLDSEGVVEPHRSPTKETDAQGRYGRECAGAGRLPRRPRR